MNACCLPKLCRVSSVISHVILRTSAVPVFIYHISNRKLAKAEQFAPNHAAKD